MPEQSLASGVVEILDLYVEDRNTKQFFGAGSIRTAIKELDPNHSSFQIDSPSISKPYIYFELNDFTNNFFEMLCYEPANVDSVKSTDTDKGYLFAQNDSTQIQVYRSDIRVPQNVGSNPRFEVKYSVKEAELDDSEYLANLGESDIISNS